MRASLPTAEACASSVAVLLAVRFPGLRVDWTDGHQVRFVVVRGRARGAVVVARDLIILAPPEALAAEIGPHLAASLIPHRPQSRPGERPCRSS